MIKGQDHSYNIEWCKSKHHAVEGAKRFPVFYDMAIRHGYQLQHSEFRHPDGRIVDYSYAMDLDRTEASFEKLLVYGI